MKFAFMGAEKTNGNHYAVRILESDKNYSVI